MLMFGENTALAPGRRFICARVSGGMPVVPMTMALPFSEARRKM